MYEQNLIDAMSIIVDGAIKKLKFDKTIQAEIFQVVDLETAEYKVKYAGNIFSAFANDLTYEYKVGDNVFIKIPDGDFTNKKFIENKVSARTVQTQGILSDQIFDLTPPVVEFKPKYKMGVRSKLGNDIFSATKDNNNDNKIIDLNIADSLTTYSKVYKNFQIKAKFTTNFSYIPTRGNYGIRVIFNTNQVDENNKAVLASFILDKTSFIGNPYSNVNGFEQKGEFSISEEVELTNVYAIELFCQGFEKNEDSLPEVDIVLEDFSMQFIDIVDLNNVPYYVKINTPEGFIRDEVKLQAQFFINGQLQEDDNYDIQWYEQNLRVTAANEYYDRVAGYGWARLDGETSSTIIVKRKNYNNIYKAVVTYRSSSTVSATVSIPGKDTIDLYLIQKASKLTVQSDDLKISEQLNNYCYTWYVSMSNGSYSLIEDEENGTKGFKEIDISRYLIYTGVVLYCIVEDENNVLANLSSIGAKEELSEIDVAFEGDDLFNYDANGDVKIEEAELDRTIIARISNENSTYQLIWVAPDGKELDNITQTSPYSPSKSMIERMWQDREGILHFNIGMKFNLSNNNNIIGLKLIDINNDITYLFRKEITFIKDGNQGTNGTTYAAKIVYCDINENELSGFHGLDYGKTPSEGSKYLKAIIYHNGQIIDNLNGWNIKWTGVNVNITNNKTQSISISRPNDANTFEDEHYVRVEITNPNITNLNPHFAVDVYKNLNEEDIDISTIPNSIIYSSSGTNPQYYAEPLVYKYQNKELNNFINLGTIGIIRLIKEEWYLNPPMKLTSMEEKMGVYKLSCGDGEIVHTTLMYINTYGNEAINGWDGISIAIDNNKGTIFAPQIGAGTKDSETNKFTGVIMGQVTDASYGTKGNRVYGLYGYKAGENTFYLNEDGNCYLAGTIDANNGHIGGWSIDEDSIYSGSKTGNSTNDIRLSSTTFNRSINNVNRGNLRFAIGNSFAVNNSGILYANNAIISGDITTDNLQATGGSIGGWDINNGYLSSGNLILNGSQGTITGGNSWSTGFSLSSSGIIANGGSFEDVSVSGTIMADNFYIYMYNNAGYPPRWEYAQFTPRLVGWENSNGTETLMWVLGLDVDA